MTETDQSAPASGNNTPRSVGQALVANFRAARINQRPSLQAQLRAERAALRQERLVRLSRAAPVKDSPAPAPPNAEEHDPPPAGENSIFAGFIDGAQGATARPAEHEPVARSEPDVEVAPPRPVLPLSAIGFGPGMVIRFRQLGIENTSDLAASDPAALRTALGDITRLINVDVWIAAAQKACAA